jgi:simple sugar transport system substrate-binding protein
MSRPRNRAVGAALLMVVILILAACSSTGGKKAAEQAQNVVAGHATTPHYTIAMITHAGPGQSFWDTERYGGVARGVQGQLHPQVCG